MRRLLVALVAVVAAVLAAVTLAAQGPSGAAQGAGATQGAPAPPPVTAAPKGQIIQKIIVKVNGEIFTQTELEFLQVQLIREENRQVKTAAELATDPGLQAMLAAITPGILVDAVNELLIVQHGREQKYQFTEEQFARSMEDLKKSNKLDDKGFLEALKQEGVTLAELRVKLERAWFVQTVRQREIMRSMTLTEEETRAYYNAHPDEFMKPPTVTLREILIAVPADPKGGGMSFSVSADDTAKQKIAAVRDRAAKGEDFTKLVDEVSESPSKANGGLIGTLEVATLNPALTELLDKMKPGEITEPLRTKAGYQIIRLDARSAAEPETFEKSRDDIAQRIIESRIDVELGKFLDRLLIQAVIEWKDDGYKKLYETERAARAKREAPKGGK